MGKLRNDDEAERKAREPRKRPVPEWAQLWLQSDKRPRVTPTSAGPEASCSTRPAAPPARTLDEDEEHQVATELAEVRAWLAHEVPAMGENFAIRILGGKWCAAHKGTAWDAVQGYAKGGMPRFFLRELFPAVHDAVLQKPPLATRCHLSRIGMVYAYGALLRHLVLARLPGVSLPGR